MVFGEQVQSPDGLTWLDLVSTDLESIAYTPGATGLCGASVGAPHARNRLYFVGVANSQTAIGRRTGKPAKQRGRIAEAGGSGAIRVMGHSNEAGRERRDIGRDSTNERATGAAGVVSGVGNSTETRCVRDEDGRRSPKDERIGPRSSEYERTGSACGLGNPGKERIRAAGHRGPDEASGGMRGIDGQRERIRVDAGQSGPVNGFWRDAHWIYCRPERPGEAGKYRPVEPIITTMDDGSSCRMGLGGDQGIGSDERSEESEEEKLDEKVPEVPINPSPQEIQREAGGQNQIQLPEVLREDMHGGGDDEGGVSGYFAQSGKSAPDDETEVRIVRESSETSASSGRESTQQHTIEFAEFVRFLPRAMPLHELQGISRSSEILRPLYESLGEAWAVQHASDTAEEIWESLGEENQGRARVAFNSATWVMGGVSPLIQKGKARTQRLHGYGDGIVAQVAAELIKAYMHERGIY